jgi:hypothetical protein
MVQGIEAEAHRLVEAEVRHPVEGHHLIVEVLVRVEVEDTLDQDLQVLVMIEEEEDHQVILKVLN